MLLTEFHISQDDRSITFFSSSLFLAHTINFPGPSHTLFSLEEDTSYTRIPFFYYTEISWLFLEGSLVWVGLLTGPLTTTGNMKKQNTNSVYDPTGIYPKKPTYTLSGIQYPRELSREGSLSDESSNSGLFTFITIFVYLFKHSGWKWLLFHFFSCTFFHETLKLILTPFLTSTNCQHHVCATQVGWLN